MRKIFFKQSYENKLVSDHLNFLPSGHPQYEFQLHTMPGRRNDGEPGFLEESNHLYIAMYLRIFQILNSGKSKHS